MKSLIDISVHCKVSKYESIVIMDGIFFFFEVLYVCNKFKMCKLIIFFYRHITTTIKKEINSRITICSIDSFISNYDPNQLMNFLICGLIALIACYVEPIAPTTTRFFRYFCSRKITQKYDFFSLTNY